MTNYIAPVGKLQARQLTGAVLGSGAGYKLYTYISGSSSTPLATYQTRSGTANANPVVFDSRGEADVWLSEATAYRFVLKTSADVTIWTQDNIYGPEDSGVSAQLRTDLASTSDSAKGDALIGVKSTITGGTARTQHDKNADIVSIFDFFSAAQIADVRAGTGAVNVASAIATALTSASGVCALLCPPGRYICNTSVAVPVNSLLMGAGDTTIFEFTGTGDGFTSTHSINSSTAARTELRDLYIKSTNGANTGGGFVDVGGTYVDLFRVRFSGNWKYSVIFDQTEIATIDRCWFSQGATSWAAVWLVNGGDHTGGANINYTNRITISQNQFNADGAALYNIIDDGGSNHTFVDNNFNGGVTAMRLSGVYGLTILENEVEVHTTADLQFYNTTLAGASVGPCVAGEVTSNVLIGQGPANIDVYDLQSTSIKNNCFGQASACMNFRNGAANPAVANTVENNYKLVFGTGKTVGPFISGHAVCLRNNDIRQGAMTYVAASQGAGTITVTPKSMEFIYPGTRLHCVNADFTNSEDVVVTDIAATTFTAVFATAKAANWTIFGATQYKEQQDTWTPVLAGASTPGTNTYTIQRGMYFRHGNLVNIQGIISVSAMPVAMVGTLLIKGLPFKCQTDSASNVFTISTPIWAGFSMPANYTNIGGEILQNVSQITLGRMGSGQVFANLAASDIPGTTCLIEFSGWYLTDAL